MSPFSLGLPVHYNPITYLRVKEREREKRLELLYMYMIQLTMFQDHRRVKITFDLVDSLSYSGRRGYQPSPLVFYIRKDLNIFGCSVTYFILRSPAGVENFKTLARAK